MFNMQSSIKKCLPDVLAVLLFVVLASPISSLPTSKGVFSTVTMHQRGAAQDKKVSNIWRKQVNVAVGRMPSSAECLPTRWHHLMALPIC